MSPPTPNFSDFDTVLAECRSKCGAVEDDDSYSTLINTLILSAGTDSSGTTQYRPYYCAALFLEQDPGTQAISSGDGLSYTGMKTAIVSLYQLQASVDKLLGLTLPPGFEVPIDKLPPKNYNAYLFGTHSARTKTVP